MKKKRTVKVTLPVGVYRLEYGPILLGRGVRIEGSTRR